MRKFLIAVILVAALAQASSHAQQSVIQGGPSSPGHAPMYYGTTTQPTVMDSGPAGGGGPGYGLSELNVTTRAPGTGPLATHGCFQDAPTTTAKYHYLCLDPNSQGGGLLAYGASGTASLLPFNLFVNGKDAMSVDSTGVVSFPSGTTVIATVATSSLVTATGANTPRTLGNLFADTVNIKDYGALGDGVADDTAAINLAVTQASLTGRNVYLPPTNACYLISSSIAIPSGMGAGSFFSDALQASLCPANSFAGSSMMNGNALLSLFTLQNIIFDVKNNQNITTVLNFSRSPESSIQDKFINVRIVDAYNNSTGINLDGCEDTTLDAVSVNFQSGSHGKAIVWHVPGGNIHITHAVWAEPSLIQYQDATIESSTIGAIYTDGFGLVLNMIGDYSYADTNMGHTNIGTTTASYIVNLNVLGGYYNPNNQNNVTAIVGSYIGHINVTGMALDQGPQTGYSLFSSSTVPLSSNTPAANLIGPFYFSGTVQGTPGAGVSVAVIGPSTTLSGSLTASSVVGTNGVFATGNANATVNSSFMDWNAGTSRFYNIGADPSSFGGAMLFNFGTSNFSSVQTALELFPNSVFGDWLTIQPSNVGAIVGTNGGYLGLVSASHITHLFDAQVIAAGTMQTGGTLAGGTTFTVASGCGTVAAVTGGATTGSFTAGATSCAPVINLPTAPNGWFCQANDITHPADLFTQTAKSVNSCTLSATVTASDVIVFHAEGY